MREHVPRSTDRLEELRGRARFDAGRQPPDTGPIQSLLQAEAQEQDQLQQAVLGLHEQLLAFLTAADFRLGKAYGLGRALAETARLPDAEEPASFQRAFGRYRLANIRFVRHFWITTALTAVILVGAIVTVFLVHATSTVVAVVVAGAGAVGVTWKGAASSLGRVLAQAQRPLWESELDAVVAGAVTLLPRRRRSADRPADPNGADQEPEVAAADAGDLEELHG